MTSIAWRNLDATPPGLQSDHFLALHLSIELLTLILPFHCPNLSALVTGFVVYRFTPYIMQPHSIEHPHIVPLFGYMQSG